MGASQSSLPSFIFPEMSESDLKSFVTSLNSLKLNLDLKYERTLGKGRVSWSMLVRKENEPKSLLLMRLYAKKSNGKQAENLGRRRNPSISMAVDPLAATKLSFIHELYYEKCSQFDFVLKPVLINDSDEFLVMIRPFARYNLPDRLMTESLAFEDKLWIGEQLVENFIKLHGLRAFHGDFGSGKVFLTSQNKVMIGDFAPIKPFGLQSKQQSPIEFYQIWFDEGFDGEANEIGKGCYLAPERLKFNAEESFEGADLFSLGCVLAELFGSGARGFLQFKDTLKLSQATETYSNLLNDYIEQCEVIAEVVPLIKNLCARDPRERSLTLNDLELVRSLSDEKIRKWRTCINNYKQSESFYRKKKLIISDFPSEVYDCECLILMILKEKNPILTALLLKYFLENCIVEKYLNILIEALKDNQIVQNVIYEYLIYNSNISVSREQFPLIWAMNSGNREVIFQQISKESDLKRVLRVLEGRSIKRDLLKGILNKLFQIYRSRDYKDVDFEARLLFEYLNIEADEEEVGNLYTTFKIDQNFRDTAKLSRVAYQLDLERNKVPIEEGKPRIVEVTKTSEVKYDRFSKFKQRLLTKLSGVEEEIIGVIQSPDRNFFICYSKTSLFVWNLKNLMRSAKGNNIPLASVNPRSESIITSIIFGDDPEILIISFKDGIIGLYKIGFKEVGLEFSIKESFGPFNSVPDFNLKLLMRTCKSGRVLLVIDKVKIYGISLKEGEVLFEIIMEDCTVIDGFEGCLLCIDNSGRFQLIEIFYQTGQVLATWHLNFGDFEGNWTIESSAIHKISSEKFNLIVKLSNDMIGKVILVYLIDPKIEVVTCTFRHWIIRDFNDKKLPFIKCLKGLDGNSHLSVNLSASLLGFEEEIVEESDGILRLIDFKCMSSMNTTSILYPPAYKPTIKLRNRNMPEIVEKMTGKYNEISENVIGKLITLDGKNAIVVAIIDKTILLHC